MINFLKFPGSNMNHSFNFIFPYLQVMDLPLEYSAFGSTTHHLDVPRMWILNDKTVRGCQCLGERLRRLYADLYLLGLQTTCLRTL